VLGDLIAVARGVGSTWAGLPPAPVVPSQAADPLDGARPWFAFVPRARTAELPPALGHAASVSFEDGTAIRTSAVPLATARAAFDSILPAADDVSLYPVDG
jgi:hypothetical protein